MSFLVYLKDGINLGSIYAMIALGYTMVYGIVKMLNFAHGDVIMVGAFVILTAITKAGLSPAVAILLSVVICTLMGVVIEAVAYRPQRGYSSDCHAGGCMCQEEPGCPEYPLCLHRLQGYAYPVQWACIRGEPEQTGDP